LAVKALRGLAGLDSRGIVSQITTLSDADETLFREQFTFYAAIPSIDIDFSYARVWHSSFTNAVFMTPRDSGGRGRTWSGAAS
jgi:hypothetical protein